MAKCLLGLGSNQGNRGQMLRRAIARLGGHPAIRISAQSPWYETAAVGGPAGQAPYFNGALLIETSLEPQALLAALQAIEAELGRRRQQRWEARPIDLDLLLYEQLVVRTPSLVLPHPRMVWRRFVLQPAAAIAGSMVHPTTGWTVSRLLEHLDTAVPYLAVTGPIGAGKTELAGQLAQRTGARLLAEPLDFHQLAAFYADPASHAWPTELQFLQQRRSLLAAEGFPGSPLLRSTGSTVQSPWVISDFWFDQSAAFARVWLSADQWERFRTLWQEARQQVVRPKLLVLLDAPAEELRRRITDRGRACEQDLGLEQLERIRRSMLAEATQPDQGPVLQLTHADPAASLAEVLAAMESMHARCDRVVSD